MTSVSKPSPRPRILLTAGEPAGIGPDLCLALAGREQPADIVYVGDPKIFQSRARDLGLPLTIETRSPGALWTTPTLPGSLPVLALNFPRPDCRGRPLAENAREMLRGLALAAELTAAGSADALVTAPVQKSSVNDAGIPFSGHTEFLAETLGAPLPVMMLCAGDLKVALATTHLPLSEVPKALNKELLTSVLTILERDLRERYGIQNPRIIVCGLNPHAGEGGHLGHEEISLITPLLETLRNQGMNVIGPLPADTAFTPAAGPRDVVLAMYHDQGLPVLKYAGFGNAVNVTLGLPIVRTSVDHGTALALAGTGKADSGSLQAAVDEACKLCHGA